MQKLKAFIVKFISSNDGNGFAIILADTLAKAEATFKALSIASARGATIITAKEVSIPNNIYNTEVIAECISSNGLSAYLVAVNNGYEGTEEQWTKEIIELKTIDPATEEEIGEIVV